MYIPLPRPETSKIALFSTISIVFHSVLSMNNVTLPIAFIVKLIVAL